MRAIERLSIRELVKCYTQGNISPYEYCLYMLNRIHEKQNLNAFITVMADKALEFAKESEKRYLKGKPLSAIDGVPVGIKDIFDVEGVATTYGCEAYENNIAKADSGHVELLKKNGAIIMGKTNTCQFALGPLGDVSYKGACKNPLDPALISGGSSSGSGVAVGACMLTAATGSDAGGSIRLPSSHCGLVGLKPTMGRVSNYHSTALSFPIDVIGPMARNVTDNALMLNSMAGYDIRDPFSAPLPNEDFTLSIGESINGNKIAVALDAINNDIDAQMSTNILKSIDILANNGAKTLPVSLSQLFSFREAHQNILTVSAFAEFSEAVNCAPDSISGQVYERMTSAKCSGVQLAMYQSKKKRFQIKMLELLEGCEVLVLPTTPCTACKIGDCNVKMGERKETALTAYPRYTWIANFSGFPAITLPTGVSKQGKQTSISFIARPFDERILYKYASLLERKLKGAV